MGIIQYIMNFMSLAFLLAFSWCVDCGKISLSDFEQLTLAPVDQDTVTVPADHPLIDTNFNGEISFPLDGGRPGVAISGIVPLKERRCGRRILEPILSMLC